MESSLPLHFDWSNIWDNSATSILRQVAGFNAKRIPTHPMNTENLFSLVVTTQGDYSLMIILCTSHDILLKMTEHMKHGIPPRDGDIPIYTSEFFNILCGHIVSALNRRNHLSARFSIPRFVDGDYAAARRNARLNQYFYDCGDGIVKLETLLMNDQ